MWAGIGSLIGIFLTWLFFKFWGGPLMDGFENLLDRLSLTQILVGCFGFYGFVLYLEHRDKKKLKEEEEEEEKRLIEEEKARAANLSDAGKMVDDFLKTPDIKSLSEIVKDGGRISFLNEFGEEIIVYRDSESKRYILVYEEAKSFYNNIGELVKKADLDGYTLEESLENISDVNVTMNKSLYKTNVIKKSDLKKVDKK